MTTAAVELRERLGEEAGPGGGGGGGACGKVFRVQVKFGSSSRVEFDPSLEQFQTALKDLWEGKDDTNKEKKGTQASPHTSHVHT